MYNHIFNHHFNRKTFHLLFTLFQSFHPSLSHSLVEDGLFGFDIFFHFSLVSSNTLEQDNLFQLLIEYTNLVKYTRVKPLVDGQLEKS